MRCTMYTLILAGVLALAGCTTHYRVSDPSSGKTYYTTKVKQLSSGATEFKDDKTGSKVTIQNSEITKVSKEAYHEGLAGEQAQQ